jgi:hypothetical protein
MSGAQAHANEQGLVDTFRPTPDLALRSSSRQQRGRIGNGSGECSVIAYADGAVPSLTQSSARARICSPSIVLLAGPLLGRPT